jgi:hypothetical protein
MTICPVAAEGFNEGGQTDMMKLIVAFRSFGNAPKNAANSAMADKSSNI